MIYQWKKIYGTRFYVVRSVSNGNHQSEVYWCSAAIVDDFGQLVLIETLESTV